MTLKQKKADQDLRRSQRRSIKAAPGSSLKARKAASDARRKLRG